MYESSLELSWWSRIFGNAARYIVSLCNTGFWFVFPVEKELYCWWRGCRWEHDLLKQICGLKSRGQTDGGIKLSFVKAAGCLLWGSRVTVITLVEWCPLARVSFRNFTIRFMPIPIIDASQALKASPEKTEDALLKVCSYWLLYVFLNMSYNIYHNFSFAFIPTDWELFVQESRN